MNGSFKKTETWRRLTELAKQARALDGDLRMNDRVEVGLRVIHQISSTLDGATVWVDGDDLSDHVACGTGEAAADPACQMHGSVLHLYFSECGQYGELKNTVVGWMGTPDQEPQITNVPRVGRSFQAPGRSGEEPGVDTGILVHGTPVVDTTTPTAVPAAELQRRADHRVRVTAERAAAAAEREAAEEARRVRYAAGEFEPGDLVRGPGTVAGYVTTAPVSFRVVKVVARGSRTELRVKRDTGHGDKPLFRMTLGEVIL